MHIEATRDRERIEAFLRRNAPAHVYAIADLDDPHWPRTRWYGASVDGDLVGLCVLLDAPTMPILYAVCPADHAPTRALLGAIRDELPERFFYNLGPGLEGALRDWQLAPQGRYWKMVLRDPDPAARAGAEGRGVEVLGPEDFEALDGFLSRDAYLPHETGGLFFDASMLATRCYRAIREDGRLVAAGGVHVHSPRLGVAGIGNLVTRPEARGRGLGGRVAAAVVSALRASADTIGLNVHEDNLPARRCYRRLGFEPVCPYDEGVALRRSRAS